MGRVKWKSAFEHVQNMQIQIILHMHTVLSGHLLFIHTFCSIQRDFCLLQPAICGGAVWPVCFCIHELPYKKMYLWTYPIRRLRTARRRLWFLTIQGPVVQSVISLTSSLRVISLTVLADSIYSILIFFAEKMWVAFALQKLLTFFQQKISAYLHITRCKF